jgi:hypothetical protein
MMSLCLFLLIMKVVLHIMARFDYVASSNLLLDWHQAKLQQVVAAGGAS